MPARSTFAQLAAVSRRNAARLIDIDRRRNEGRRDDRQCFLPFENVKCCEQEQQRRNARVAILRFALSCYTAVALEPSRNKVATKTVGETIRGKTIHRRHRTTIDSQRSVPCATYSVDVKIAGRSWMNHFSQDQNQRTPSCLCLTHDRRSGSRSRSGTRAEEKSRREKLGRLSES